MNVDYRNRVLCLYETGFQASIAMWQFLDVHIPSKIKIRRTYCHTLVRTKWVIFVFCAANPSSRSPVLTTHFLPNYQWIWLIRSVEYLIGYLSVTWQTFVAESTDTQVSIHRGCFWSNYNEYWTVYIKVLPVIVWYHARSWRLWSVDFHFCAVLIKPLIIFSKIFLASPKRTSLDYLNGFCCEMNVCIWFVIAMFVSTYGYFPVVICFSQNQEK